MERKMVMNSVIQANYAELEIRCLALIAEKYNVNVTGIMFDDLLIEGTKENVERFLNEVDPSLSKVLGEKCQP